MKNRILYFTLLIILLCFSNSKSQSLIELPKGLSLSNQLEYAYDTRGDIEILENWFNADYRNGIFSTGIRMEVFQPNDPNPFISRGKEKYAGISFKYLQAEIGNKREGLHIRIGNFYSLFGRGMILKSFEDRNLRVDNNLLGVKIIGNYHGFRLEALTGMAENSKAERKDVLHAFDIEYRGIKKVKLAASLASNLPAVDNAAQTTLASLRSKVTLGSFDLYGEYGIKTNKDIKQNVFEGNEDFAGEAFYGNLSFYLGKLAFTGEYKYYDNFTFMSQDGTIIYNTPPAVRKDYQYVLLNRHPSPLDQNNEKGYQLEVSYVLSEKTNLAFNYSQTKTLGSESFYQRIMNASYGERKQFEEFYLQGFHAWSDNFKTIAGFGYNEELSSNTKNITPILENRIYLDENNTIKIIFEHQHSSNNITNEQKYADVLALEWLRSPNLSLTFVGEMETTEPDNDRLVRRIWAFIQLGYELSGHTDISLLIGSRQAGNICVGGICRYEPEFRGVELKMMTRLF